MAEKLMSMIDEIKEKLTDNEYKQMSEQCAAIRLASNEFVKVRVIGWRPHSRPVHQDKECWHYVLEMISIDETIIIPKTDYDELKTELTTRGSLRMSYDASSPLINKLACQVIYQINPTNSDDDEDDDDDDNSFSIHLHTTTYILTGLDIIP
jgi:hypothetical protein